MKVESNKKRMVIIINKLKERQNARIEYVESLQMQQKMYIDMSNKFGYMMNEIDKEENYKVPVRLYRGICAKQFDSEFNQIEKCLYDFERMLNKAERENTINIRNSNNLKVNLSSSKKEQVNQFGL